VELRRDDELEDNVAGVVASTFLVSGFGTAQNVSQPSDELGLVYLGPPGHRRVQLIDLVCGLEEDNALARRELRQRRCRRTLK
jgi:hypothetical protein